MTYEAANKYKQNSISTATPEELTLMLYDGAIKFMNIGKYNIENKDISKKNEALVRAQDIINELKYSLNMDYEISKEISPLYDFVLDKLIDGNIKMDINSIDEALVVITDMRDTWKEVMKEVKQGAYKNR